MTNEVEIIKELDEVLAAETGYQRAIAAGDFLHTHATAIRAALELAKLNELSGNSRQLGWQAMNTCPTNKRVLLWDQALEEVSIGHKPDDAPEDNDVVILMTASWADAWMPLPAPPAQENNDGKHVEVLRWMDQTTFYDPSDPINPNKGNCVEAAVASILGIAIPSKFGTSGNASDYWHDFEDCFAKHGFDIQRRHGNFVPDVLYLASGPSVRGCSHMVVMRSGKLVHDPHPSRKGIESVSHVWLPVPFDPCAFKILPADAVGGAG